MVTVKAFFAVAMHLIKSFTNRHPTLFQLNLHQWQTVHQNSHIVAIGMAAGLLKLLDHLHFVAGNVLFIHQIDVFDAAIVKHKIKNIIVVDFTGFIDNGIAGLVQISHNKALPFTL